MPGGQVNIDALFPSFTGEESPREQTRVMLNYLRMLTERLRYQLDNLGKENFNAVALKQIQFETTEEIEGRLGELTKTVEEIQSVIDTLGALAFKDTASGSYTPAGTVSKPTFTGTPATIKPKVTAAGEVSKPTFTGTMIVFAPTFQGFELTSSGSYTPEGSVSKPDVNVVTASKTIYSISGLGSLPSLQTVVEGEDLRLEWSPGGLPSRTSEGVVANVSAELDAAPVFTGTEKNVSVKGTPGGTVYANVSLSPNGLVPNQAGSDYVIPTGEVSKPTFTGTEVEGSASYTPAGSVSKPTFTGSPATITVE